MEEDFYWEVYCKDIRDLGSVQTSLSQGNVKSSTSTDVYHTQHIFEILVLHTEIVMHLVLYDQPYRKVEIRHHFAHFCALKFFICFYIIIINYNNNNIQGLVILSYVVLDVLWKSFSVNTFVLIVCASIQKCWIYSSYYLHII